jgi:16S rRNA (guanine527-N7)-methyltransferase
MPSDPRRLLESGARQLHIDLSSVQASKLLELLSLLAHWGKAYNLTAVRDPLRMVPYHLLDSLAVNPYVRGERILDIGTGAGFPGLPLAIVAKPGRRFVLLDSNGKKTRFVRQAVMELALTNVEVVRGRIESYQPELKFDTILARAFASLPALLDMTAPLLSQSACLLALKSRAVAAEIDQLPASRGRLQLHQLRVPYLAGARSVVEIARTPAFP